MIKLFVDDQRNAPNGWHLARTITEAIRVLATTDVSHVSLDHDIAYVCTGENNAFGSIPNETFEAVARYIVLNNDFENSTDFKGKPIKVYCHSGNPVAFEKYKNILGEYLNE